MSVNAILGAPGFELETALRERLAAARRSDPFAPLTILVGSNLLGASLRRALADRTGGLFNVRFATFAGLADLLAGGEATGAGAGAPPFADRVVVGEIATAGDLSPGLAETAKTRGFAETLLATFDDLAEAGCAASTARELAGRGAPRERAGSKAREVLSLYARFRDRIDSIGGDRHTRFRAALSSPLPASLGERVFAYGFYDFNEMQRRLLARIARERDVTILMPAGAGEAFRFAARGREALERAGFGPFAPAGSPEVAARKAAPKLLNAPGEEEEVREIARRIFALVRKGLRFDEIAVILPSVETYAPLCREVFREAGIPCSMHAGLPANAGPAVRGARGLLEILRGATERRDIVEFLVSAPLRPAAVERARGDPFSLWARLSAEAGIVGERGWIEESAALAERLRILHERGEGAGEALAAALEADAVIGKIVRAGEALRAETSWRRLAAGFSSLARELFPDAADLDRARAAIECIASLDRLGSPASFDGFSRIAEVSLDDAARAAGLGAGEGVHVLSLVQARGLGFEAVFIPGLAERIFPAAARQDPFLGDRERRELNALSGGAVALGEKAERLSEEALLFELARASARTTLVCSYPRFEGGTGRERIPSSFLRFIEGYSAGGAHGAGIEYERIPRLAPAARGAELLGADELDFERSRQYRDGAGALPDNPFFSKGARLVRMREGSRKFTAYDGVFSSQQALGELRAMLDGEGRRFAPTSLEAYARCPFAYFITRVLRIEPLEEPERIISIGPLERGELIHRILARIFAELKAKGLLPLSGAPPGDVRAIAEAVIDEILGSFPESASVGYPVFWHMEQRLVRESVLLFLEEERLEGGTFTPELFEKSFGRKRDRLEVPFECGGRTVLFHGRIDRIDTAPDGRYRVVDYKTGKLMGADQDLAHGSALQLPVYLIAASRILGLDLRRGEARYRRVGVGEGKNVVSFSGERWEESREAFTKIVDTIAGGVERGVFFAPADEQGCRNCGVDIACSSGAARLFEIKSAHDERSRAYLEMRGEEGEEA